MGGPWGSQSARHACGGKWVRVKGGVDDNPVVRGRKTFRATRPAPPPPPQVPCIERNGLGAIKAVSAASLALCDDGSHLVSLDVCIKSMRQTGMLMVVCLLCLEGFPGVL